MAQLGVMLSASKVHSNRDVHLSLFGLLLNVKCDVNIADKLVWTPLYQATMIGETGKCDMLLVIIIIIIIIMRLYK